MSQRSQVSSIVPSGCPEKVKRGPKTAHVAFQPFLPPKQPRERLSSNYQNTLFLLSVIKMPNPCSLPIFLEPLGAHFEATWRKDIISKRTRVPRRACFHLNVDLCTVNLQSVGFSWCGGRGGMLNAPLTLKSPTEQLCGQKDKEKAGGANLSGLNFFDPKLSRKPSRAVSLSLSAAVGPASNVMVGS